MLFIHFLISWFKFKRRQRWWRWVKWTCVSRFFTLFDRKFCDFVGSNIFTLLKSLWKLVVRRRFFFAPFCYVAIVALKFVAAAGNTTIWVGFYSFGTFSIHAIKLFMVHQSVYCTLAHCWQLWLGYQLTLTACIFHMQ